MPGKRYEIAAQNTLTLLQKHSLFKLSKSNWTNFQIPKHLGVMVSTVALSKLHLSQVLTY